MEQKVQKYVRALISQNNKCKDFIELSNNKKRIEGADEFLAMLEDESGGEEEEEDGDENEEEEEHS